MNSFATVLEFLAGIFYLREFGKPLVLFFFIVTGMNKVLSGEHSALLHRKFIDKKKFKIQATERDNFLHLE
jgi:hypothetical protein